MSYLTVLPRKSRFIEMIISYSNGQNNRKTSFAPADKRGFFDVYTNCKEQSRGAHFAKEEKRLRYELLKKRLFENE